VLEAFSKEQRTPAAAVVSPKLNVVPLASRAGDDVANAGPRIEPAMKAAQFRPAWLK